MAKKKPEKKEFKKIEHELEVIREEVEAERKEEKVEFKEVEKELEKLKKELRPEVIEKFTYKDVARGIIGSILGMSIMGWHESVREAAMKMPWLNVFIIIILTIIGGASVLYFSQYRRIKEKWIIHRLLPKRFVIFYALSIAIIFLIYLLFGFATKSIETIKLVLVIGLPAMIGASAADIIRPL